MKFFLDMDNFFCKSTTNVKGFTRVSAPCNYNNYYGDQYFNLYDNGTRMFFYIFYRK